MAHSDFLIFDDERSFGICCWMLFDFMMVHRSSCLFAVTAVGVGDLFVPKDLSAGFVAWSRLLLQACWHVEIP